MKDNVKLDVAIEIVSSKLAEAIKNKDREKSARLLKIEKTSLLRKPRSNRYANKK